MVGELKKESFNLPIHTKVTLMVDNLTIKNITVSVLGIGRKKWEGVTNPFHPEAGYNEVSKIHNFSHSQLISSSLVFLKDSLT